MNTRSNILRVGIAQVDPILFDQSANLLKIERFLEKAAEKEVKLLVFPECSVTGYVFSTHDEVKNVAESVPSSTTEKLESMCRRFNCWVIVGLIEVAQGNYYNTAVFVSPDGMVGKYRKTHLPYLGADRFLTMGENPLQPFQTDLGRVGLAICYDFMFPEMVRTLSLLGIELLVVPTNWAREVEQYTRHLSIVRAIENHINIVIANRVGSERGIRFFGKSKIIDCNGNILSEGSQEEELLTAELDVSTAQHKKIIRVPGEWEVDYIHDRRPELYQRLIQKP